MWDGSYFGWTVENLDIRGFDWSITMIYTTGADFHRVTIRNNRIEMPTDEPGNYAAGIGEPWQNVALHLGGGYNQTVEGNEIIIPGDALADNSNPEIPLQASSVALQSNTNSVASYDGLRIIDNTIRVTGAQSVDPEWVFGIWENGGANSSDIEVRGNSFVNENPGNRPDLNLQRAFRVTSHSSEETTVIYADNLVQGANIGIHWLGDNYTSTPPAGVLPVVLEGNSLLDNDTAVWVHTDELEAFDAPAATATVGSARAITALYRSNRIVSKAVDAPPADVEASDTSVAPKVTGTPYMSKALLRFNRITGNTVGVRSDDAEVTALDNWWGCNEGPNAPDCDTAVHNGGFGFLKTDSWIVLGLSAVPDLIQVGSALTATAVLQSNADTKNGIATSPVPDGTPVTFAATGGVVNPAASETLLGSASSTYTAGAATGDFSVSATVDSETVSVGVTVVAWADLGVVVSPERQYLDDGEPASVTVSVTNIGPVEAPGSIVTVDLPAELAGVSWTCTGTDGGLCTAAGSGDVNDVADLPVGASVVYTVGGSVPDPFAGALEVSASVTPAEGFTDPETDNNMGAADMSPLSPFFPTGSNPATHRLGTQASV